MVWKIKLFDKEEARRRRFIRWFSLALSQIAASIILGLGGEGENGKSENADLVHLLLVVTVEQ